MKIIKLFEDFDTPDQLMSQLKDCFVDLQDQGLTVEVEDRDYGRFYVIITYQSGDEIPDDEIEDDVDNIPPKCFDASDDLINSIKFCNSYCEEMFWSGQISINKFNSLKDSEISSDTLDNVDQLCEYLKNMDKGDKEYDYKDRDMIYSIELIYVLRSDKIHSYP